MIKQTVFHGAKKYWKEICKGEEQFVIISIKGEKDMGVWKTIGKWLLKGGKYALKHSQEIGGAVDVAARTVSVVKGGCDKPEPALEESQREAELLNSRFAELENEIASARKIFEARISQLCTQLDQIQKKQAKAGQKLMWLAICNGVGVAIAIVLALVL